MQLVSETITPVEASFDLSGMVRSEPGVPHRFHWRKQEWTVEEVLEQWKEYGDCSHGSGERYVRKHGYRIRTTEGTILKIYFQRSFGRARFRPKGRWWIATMEEAPAAT